MNLIYMAAAAAAIIGALLLPIRYYTRKAEFRDGNTGPDNSGMFIINVFAAIVLVLGVMTTYWYWAVIVANGSLIFYAAWLVLVMIFGMFVQVLSTAYRAGKKFNVGQAELVLPLLFSIVVFYPIWAIATTSARSFFVIHAAFLNGYFWESLVAAARPPEEGAGG